MEKSRKKGIILLLCLLLLIFIGIYGASYLYQLFIAIGKAKASHSLTAFSLPEPLKVGVLSIFNADKINHANAFKGAWIVSGGVSLLLFLGIASKLNPKRSLYGDARFATISEIQQAGLLLDNKKVDKEKLFADSAVICGKVGSRYIALDDQRFIYLAAPTRSGKGTGVVNIVLLSYDHSIVVLDIKKELFNISAAKRAKNGHKVFLFDPYNKDGKTARWNPLSYVRRDLQLRIDDIQKIAQTIVPPQGNDPLWTDAPRDLFCGLVLYQLDKERLDPNYTPTIRNVLDLIQQTGGKDTKTHFANLIDQDFVLQQTKDKSVEKSLEAMVKDISGSLNKKDQVLLANALSQKEAHNEMMNVVNEFFPYDSPNYNDAELKIADHLAEIYNKGGAVTHKQIQSTREQFKALQPKIRQEYYQATQHEQHKVKSDELSRKPNKDKELVR